MAISQTETEKGARRAYWRAYYQTHKEKLKAKSRKYRQEHKDWYKTYWRNYWAKHRKEHREYGRVARLRLKTEVLTHYGNGKLACIKCGFADIRALSLDHINGDGCKHRKETGRIGQSFYSWLKLNNFPEGYQTLCFNCQMIKKAEKWEYGEMQRRHIGFIP